jgi:hypothetical protein
VKTQSEREQDEKARQAQADELKASDFFPPGVGWNQEGGKDPSADPRQPNATEQEQKRH